jgi:hypothetical protein
MDRSQDDSRRVREEEEAAAFEAGTIGGRSGDEELDDEERPLVEAGQGEAEGFELAEQDLIEHAEQQEGEEIPELDQLGEEAEENRAVYGEPDEEDVTEVVRDPEIEDDPGAGPGLAADR